MSKLITHDGRLDSPAIASKALAISNEVKAGLIDPIQLLAEIEFVKKVCDKVRKDITDDAMAEIYNHAAQKADVAGMTIELRESGVKLDYSNTPAWVELDNEINELKERQKAIENMAKAVQSQTYMADPETGEMIELNPPIRTSGESLFCTPKR